MTAKGWMLVMLGVIIGVGLYYAYTNYYAPPAQQVPQYTPPSEIPLASLEETYDYEGTHTSFDFSSDVGSDGSVSAEADEYADITIYNNDTRDAQNVIISLRNSITGKNGLPTALQKDELEAYITITSGYTTRTIYLYKDGKFQNFDLGTIQKNSQVTFRFTIKLKEADPDTFVDGRTYHINLFVIQGNKYYDTIEMVLDT